VVQLDTSLGQVPAHDGKIDVLGLGAIEVRDLAVGVVERRMPHANFLLGTDVLSRFGVLLDLADEPYLIFDPVEGKANVAAPPEAPAKKPEEKPAAAEAPPAEAPRRKGD